MEKIILVQFGAGGMAWLLFTVGLLWCGFAWWRATRCRRALASVIASITALVSGAIMIAMLVSASTGIISRSSGNHKMIEAIALGFFILTGVSWAIGAVSFLLAAMNSHYPSREELAAEAAPPTST